MRAEGHLWRTADGELVLDGDPAAAILAYAPGDEVAAADEGKVPGKSSKAKASAPNKARTKTDNK